MSIRTAGFSPIGYLSTNNSTTSKLGASLSQPISFQVRSSKKDEYQPADLAGQTKVRTLLADIRRLVNTTSDEPTRRRSTVVSFGQPSAEPATFKTVTRVGSTLDIKGANNSQISGADVRGLRDGSELRIEGEVTKTQAAAQLTIRGSATGTATAGGLYSLAGNRGQITLDIKADESLAGIAQRINQQTSSTGIVATRSNNDLVLTSSETGSDAIVRFQPLAVSGTTLTGLNDQQISNLEVVSQANGATETLSGSFTAAQSAELRYRGDAGGVATGTASFRLTGARGETTISLTKGESLTDVAARINSQTAATGVVATLEGNDLKLASDTTGAAASVRVDAVQTAHDQTVSGVNAAQGTFTVISLADGSQHDLSGQVTRTASAAELALQGSEQATIIDTATFALTGSLGSTEISVTAGESLADVATRVNNLSGSTGVTAQVSGNQLLLQSTELGSAAVVEVELIHAQHTTTVSGVNSQQLTSFQVDQFTEGASQTLSGVISQTGSQTELMFKGTVSQTVGTDATFTLTGSLGSVQLSTTAGQSLSSLAAAVNQHTGTTGVTASVAGRNLRFRNGGAAAVSLQVNSGSFEVTAASSLNAVAEINGQTITGVGNTFQFSDASGSYSFTVASGFTGAFSTVSIVSEAGSIGVTGGNGDGTATGLDALAEINGVALTGEGNHFTVSQASDQFALDFAAGFTGQFDPITVSSTAHEFQVDGGDGAGLSSGADALAMINGAQYSSDSNEFIIQTAQGTYNIEFAAGFSGQFDPVTIGSQTETLSVEGGVNGFAVGSDAEAIINGQQLFAIGSQFEFEDAGRKVSLSFQAGFRGQFDTITASNKRYGYTEQVRTSEPAAPRPVEQTSTTVSRDQSISATSTQELNLLLGELGGLLKVDEKKKPDAAESATAAANHSLTKKQIANQQFVTLYNSFSSPKKGGDANTLAGLAQLRQAIDLLG